jgi:transglutaminase-like putative cysteine protease
MRLDIKFRLSVYLSLVLASACLGHAEEAFLPGVLIFVTTVSVLFALAFVLEGRWSLTVLAANILGVFIASGAALWILSRLLRPPEGFGVAMPWQAMLLPYIGPVLICLVLAKLFRPKQVNDFWLLHTVGLMEVILACVLAAEPLFGVLLLAYVICALWSLSLFHSYRERLRAGGDVTLPLPTQRGRLPGLGVILPAIGWSCLLLALALPLFLLTPKLGESAWSPFSLHRSGPAIVAYSDGMDLNRVGRLRPTDKVAFEVEARDAGDGPKTDLDLEQRWRGAVLDHYEHGRWYNRDQTSLGLPRRNPTVRWRFPRIVFPRPQRGEYTLAFAVPSETTNNALFLSDPMWLPDEDVTARVRLVPIAGQNPEGRKSWNYEPNDFTMQLVSQQITHRYVQLLAPSSEPGLSPRVHDNVSTDPQYVQAPPLGVRRFAIELVQRLREAGRFGNNDFTLVGEELSVGSAKWETVATAFMNYFANSGDFSYSLELTRKDMTLDPNEDFLRNLRRGHCERFASALALLLRACGIPSRVVIGFRGTEPQGDGNYVVRQNAAHGWVEVLVPRPQADGSTHWHWRTFDPTPSDEEAGLGNAAKSQGWPGWQGLGNLLWRNFMVDYNAEKRGEAAAELARWFSPMPLLKQVGEWAARTHAEWWGLGVVLAIAAAFFVRRRQGERPPAPPPIHDFGFPAYAALLIVLKERLKLEPRPSQTPLEFALAAGAALRRHPTAVDLADAPAQVVDALYRSFYGKRETDPREEAALEQRVRQIGGLDLSFRAN